MKISSGPLQGFTDDVFRKVHHEIYGGVDEYFGPYIRLEAHKEVKASQVRDIESSYNQETPYIPQILSSNTDLIIQQIQKLQLMGFETINWNLGCPYPMVTKRNMGSGLLNQAGLVKEILHQIFHKTQVQLNIKCRLGLEDANEIYHLLEVFNEFELKEVIIHARTAKQMYKGEANPKKILPLLDLSRHPIAYNGDIYSIDDFKRVVGLLDSKINHFMLGRGLLANPALASQIIGKEIEPGSFKRFHHSLIEHYLQRYQEHQLLKKMQAFWEYFGLAFPEERKVLKKIKKAKKWEAYMEASNQIINQNKNR